MKKNLILVLVRFFVFVCSQNKAISITDRKYFSWTETETNTGIKLNKTYFLVLIQGGILRKRRKSSYSPVHQSLIGQTWYFAMIPRLTGRHLFYQHLIYRRLSLRYAVPKDLSSF